MIQCLSIASFCALYLKPLFEIMDSGFIRSDDLRRKGQTNQEGSFDLSAMSSGKEHRGAGKALEQISQGGNNRTSVTALPNEDGWEGGSQSSEAQMIRETRTFTIESSRVDEENLDLRTE